MEKWSKKEKSVLREKCIPTEEEKIKTKLKSILHQSNDKKKKKIESDSKNVKVCSSKGPFMHKIILKIKCNYNN